MRENKRTIFIMAMFLLALKALDVISASWLRVLLVCACMPATLWLLNKIFPTFLLLSLAEEIDRWCRDRRIIRQAKAAGVWDKPASLGGRALELRAWKDFKIKRQYGENDWQLRNRYKAAAEEHTTTPN